VKGRLVLQNIGVRFVIFINIERFPERYCFRLSKIEQDELVAKCDRFKSLKHSTSLMHAYSEPGIAMLSSVLKSATAIKISVQVIDAYRCFFKRSGQKMVRVFENGNCSAGSFD
jgi:hypothetical protein